MKKWIKDNRIYFALILAFTIFFYANYISGELKGDLPTFWSFSYQLIKTSFLERGSLHEWADLVSGGVPFFAYGEFPLLDITFWLVMIAPTAVAAAHASFFIHLLLAGLGMFLLANELMKDRNAALVSAIVFMFSGFFINHVSSNISYAYPFAYIPLIFFFAGRALGSHNWAFYSVLTGVVFAFQILSGGSLIFLLTMLSFGFFLLVHIFGKNFAGRAAKAGLVAAVSIAVALGLGAIKILPSYEFLNASARAGGVSYNEFLWSNVIPMSKLLSGLVGGIAGSTVMLGRVGIIALLLGLTGLWLIRKKYVAFAALVAASSLLVVTGTPYARLLYDFAPGFNNIRDITAHINSQLVFAAAILAGAGFSLLGQCRASPAAG